MCNVTRDIPRAHRVAPGALCALLAALVLVGGCAKARSAAVTPTAPPLDVPTPPQRVVAPPETPLPAAASVPDAPVPAVAPVVPRPQPPRRAGGAPVEPPPAATTAVPEPPRDLRPGSVPEGQAERQVRDVLARTTRDLGRVNVARLSADGRAQFEQARRFSQQAEQALRSRNVVFAVTLADKAASLAADLAAR